MFRDCWDYICYKIQDTILKNGQKQNRKKQENINRTTHRKAGFLLQKTAVVIAGILWLIAAARVFWNMPQTGVQENVLSAFGSASYKEVCADISAYGKYGSMELTDTAKEIILEKAAEKIGISRYTIEQTSRDNVETMQLSQNGENGSVLCRFITIHQENVEYEQYLYIGVTLKNTVDASFTYEKLIRQIMEEMQIDTEVNVNLKGQIHGALTDTQKEQFAQDMLDMKNDRKTRTCAEKEPGTGADARRAGHPVCGPAAHRAGLCGGQLGLEGPARGIVRPVRLRQLRAGRSDLLSGHPLHTGRRPHRPDVQADAGAGVCQRHRHRLFRDPRRHPGGPHGSGVLSERRPCLAGRRCHRCPAGRQSAAALRASGGESRDGGAGALCQPVHF